MMESVLNQWDSLTKSDAALDTQLSNSLIRSELESLFLNRLASMPGWTLTPKVVGDGTRGFVLSTGEKSPMWTIEPQVQIKNRFKHMPQKIVDFLMTPLDSKVSKPIVIETDGIRYHAESITKDIHDRLDMIRSGEVQVWSFAWHDLQQDSKKPLSNPLSAAAFNPQTQANIGRVLAHTTFEPYKARIGDIQNLGSFELFVTALSVPGYLAPPTTVLLRGIVGAVPANTIERFNTLRAENRDWLLEKPFAQFTQATKLGLAVSLDKTPLSDFDTRNDDLRALICFNHQPIQSEAEITDEFVSAFRGLWRTVNILQYFPGLHIEFPGLDTLDPPTSPTDKPTTDEVDAAWAEVRAEVLDDYHTLIDALIAAEVEAPDAVGEELMQGSRVVGAAEIGWSKENIWVTGDDTLSLENLIIWDLTAETIPAVIADIISRLETSEEGK